MEFQPMSPEELQRTVQFLLTQQAQFAADLENLSGKTDRIADGLIGLTGIVGRVVEQVGEVADAQKQLAETVNGLTEHIKAMDIRLTEHIKSVDSHLDVVIDMFERHLRDDHGRKPS